MTDCVFGDWTCYNTNRIKKCRENMEKAEKYDAEHRAAMIVEKELRKIDDKLEAVEDWFKRKCFAMTRTAREELEEILGAEG